MPKVSKKGGNATEASNVSKDMNLVELYDTIDADRQTRGATHTSVSAEQIRELRDQLFDAGKDQVSVATLARLVDAKYGLAKTDEGDTRVQNSSIRSACKHGEFKIETIDNVAYVMRKA